MVPEDISAWRILEISDDSLLHELLPRQTTSILTQPQKGHAAQRDDRRKFSLFSAWKIIRRIDRGEFDLIVLSALRDRLWQPERFFLNNLFRFLKRLFLRFYTLAPYLVFFIRNRAVPVIMIDRGDSMVVGRQNQFFLPRLLLYFKRELPQNHWNMFLFTSPRTQDMFNTLRQKHLRRELPKFRPFPLRTWPAAEIPEGRAEDKTSDIFYASVEPRSTVRVTGAAQLLRLHEQGYRVDLPTGLLSREEFRRRLSAAWLAWSPEGMGWECFRHHEALIAGAVPVVNYPTIHRYQPFRPGEHLFFYACEGDDLERVVRTALADKPKLLEMVRAGRRHLAHGYTPQAMLAYIRDEIRAAT